MSAILQYLAVPVIFLAIAIPVGIVFENADWGKALDALKGRLK